MLILQFQEYKGDDMRYVSDKRFCTFVKVVLVLLAYYPIAFAQTTIHVPTPKSALSSAAPGAVAPAILGAVPPTVLSVQSTAKLPSGIAGTNYSQTLTAIGGSGSGYSWSISSGTSSLTAIGLSLSATGVISGASPVAGTANFTVLVKDSASNTDAVTFCLTINGKLLPTLHLDATAEENFFGTNGTVSPLTQVGSAYNGASSSATVSATLVSLIMPGGWQALVATNIQAGSPGETNVAQGTVPTLSASAAGQATQNMLYGGTIALAFDLPVFYYGPNIANAGGFAFELDAISREGVDVQNFKSGTSTNATAPPSHFASQLETYMLINSRNPPPQGTTGFAGTLFIGGSYGYSYTSHGYARDYGFGNRVNNDIGQVTAGIMITNVSRISVSRAFGPGQTYIDSTSMTQTKINNFKSWSFAITYQSAATPKSN